MAGFSDFGIKNPDDRQNSWNKVLEFSLKAIPGYDLRAAEKIAALLSSYELRPNRLSKLKEAVRVAASKLIEDASLFTGDQMINFQVLLSDVVVALHPHLEPVNDESTKLGWGFFLVQILDGAQSGLETRESGHLLRLYIYVEGDQANTPQGSFRTLNE